jgi:hypothetical protein
MSMPEQSTTWDHQRLIAQKIMRTRLFFISYTPLWAIFAIRSHATVGQIVFWVLTAWGFLDAFRLIEAGLHRSTRHIHFDNVSDRSGHVSGYLATYLLPFISGPPMDLRAWLAYGVYFLVAWAVFVPSDLGLVNPTLYILGWRLVEGTRQGRRELIICQDLPDGESEGEPVARLMGGAGWIRRPTRRPWTWVSRR